MRPVETFPLLALEKMYIMELQHQPLYDNCLELARVLQRKDWSGASREIPSLLQRMVVKRHVEAGRGRKYDSYVEATRILTSVNF